MSATTPHSPDTPDGSSFTTIGPDACCYERYAAVELAENAVLVYDRDDDNAWISSDVTVSLGEAV